MKHETEKQKKSFIPASIEIIRFTTEDIMTTGKLSDPNVDLPVDWFTH